MSAGRVLKWEKVFDWAGVENVGRIREEKGEAKS